MSGTTRVLVGITVERRVIWIPQGLAVGPAVCVESPTDCCPASGSGVGCCAAPSVLYATLYVDGACSCLRACVVLVYDAGADAWYSTQGVADVCGVAGIYLRLQCRDAVWAMDLVDGAGGTVIVLDGNVDQSEVVCEPVFYAAGNFDDSASAIICDGAFAYVISESDCTGAGGGVENDCCPDDPTPATLYATFGGALAGLGTVTLVATGGLTNQWVGTASGACGNVQVSFLCLAAPNFSMSVVGDSACSFEGLEAATCAPFLWEASGVSTGTCAGACDVSVSDVAP